MANENVVNMLVNEAQVNSLTSYRRCVSKSPTFYASPLIRKFDKRNSYYARTVAPNLRRSGIRAS